VARQAPTEPPTGGAQLTTAWRDYLAGIGDGYGVSDGSTAPPGRIGQFDIVAGGPISLTSNVLTNIVSMGVTAGDYEAWGNIQFTPTGAAVPTVVLAGVGIASGVATDYAQIAATMPSLQLQRLPTPVVRFNLDENGILYLIGRSVFTGGALSAVGTLSVRRIR